MDAPDRTTASTTERMEAGSTPAAAHPGIQRLPPHARQRAPLYPDAFAYDQRPLTPAPSPQSRTSAQQSLSARMYTKKIPYRSHINSGRRSGTSMGTRTPVFAVRGRRLNRLTMEAYWQPN